MERTTLFTCQHPLGRRRTYRVTTTGATAECEVCWECRAARSVAGGWWEPRAYLYANGDLLELDGRVRIRGYWQWRERAPIAS